MTARPNSPAPFLLAHPEPVAPWPVADVVGRPLRVRPMRGSEIARAKGEDASAYLAHEARAAGIDEDAALARAGNELVGEILFVVGLFGIGTFVLGLASWVLL